MTPPALGRRVRTLRDVVDWGPCTGWGIRAAACSRGGVSMVDLESAGLRPRFQGACAGCSACLAVGPGYHVDARLAVGREPPAGVECDLGLALEICQGHARDPEIRARASSGGLLTALALHCLERERMAFVLHAGVDPGRPWATRTVQSRSRAELFTQAGSRYAPAAPGEGLRAIEASDRPAVFIGKPCDAAGAMTLRRKRPALDRNLGLVLTFFCAGTPATRGTLELVRALAVDPASTRAVHYRGEGWPGRFRVRHGYPPAEASDSYEASWGRLQHHRPLRCHLCPGGLGRVADLACGDAWHHASDGLGLGRSLVLVRTERGRAILSRARAAGAVDLAPARPEAVLAAQPGLLGRRRELFGRLLGMRLLLVPTPRFAGFALLRSWAGIRAGRKPRTAAGTTVRLLRRGRWRRRALAAGGRA